MGASLELYHRCQLQFTQARCGQGDSKVTSEGFLLMQDGPLRAFAFYNHGLIVPCRAMKNQALLSLRFRKMPITNASTMLIAARAIHERTRRCIASAWL